MGAVKRTNVANGAFHGALAAPYEQQANTTGIDMKLENGRDASIWFRNIDQLSLIKLSAVDSNQCNTKSSAVNHISACTVYITQPLYVCNWIHLQNIVIKLSKMSSTVCIMEICLRYRRNRTLLASSATLWLLLLRCVHYICCQLWHVWWGRMKGMGEVRCEGDGCRWSEGWGGGVSGVFEGCRS